MVAVADDTREHAEDIAYTLNHAISCATTDMLIAPTISALFSVNVGCSDPSHQHGDDLGHGHHDHMADHSHDHHEHHAPIYSPAELHNHVHCEPHTHAPTRKKLNWKLYKSEALHYLKGEIIGDLAAVPLTILTQRFFPKLGDSLRRIAEPIAAPFFHYGAKHAAKRWGEQHGLSEHSDEVVAHAEAMYQHEIKHLPQAILWNTYAFPIGVLGQKWGGHGSSYGRIIRNKSIGALVSNGLLLGSRALVPNIAQSWDRLNSEHIIQPTTRIFGKLAGLREEDIVRATDPATWTQRVQDIPTKNMAQTQR